MFVFCSYTNLLLKLFFLVFLIILQSLALLKFNAFFSEHFRIGRIICMPMDWMSKWDLFEALILSVCFCVLSWKSTIHVNFDRYKDTLLIFFMFIILVLITLWPWNFARWYPLPGVWYFTKKNDFRTRDLCLWK